MLVIQLSKSVIHQFDSRVSACQEAQLKIWLRNCICYSWI